MLVKLSPGVISSMLNVQFFCMNVAFLCTCNKRKQRSYKKFLRLTLMKLTTGVNIINIFLRSFYICRSQKLKMIDDFTDIFALLGSMSIKAACKMLVKLTPGTHLPPLSLPHSLPLLPTPSLFLFLSSHIPLPLSQLPPTFLFIPSLSLNSLLSLQLSIFCSFSFLYLLIFLTFLSPILSLCHFLSFLSLSLSLSFSLYISLCGNKT